MEEEKEEVVNLVTLTFHELPRKDLNQVFNFAQDMGYSFSISIQDPSLEED